MRQPFLTAVIMNAALLLLSPAATAQRHGGGAQSTGGLESYSRPDGVSEKDQLKDFHEAMALQASGPQAAAFQSALKSTDTAKAELQRLLPTLGADDAANRAAILDQALANARTANNSFAAGFSPGQKSGLRDALKRIAKTDSDLEQEQKKLDQSLSAKRPAAELSASADHLDKILADFYDQQLAMGRKMSIVLLSGQDVTFTLTPVNSLVRLVGQTISVPTSGRLVQTSAQRGQRIFRLELLSSLLDLQQNITQVARAQFTRTDRCGERLEVRNASLAPASGTALLAVRLHYERWMCGRGTGSISSELAEGDGVVEIKLTAGADKQGALHIAAELGRIDATGMMAESLRNGLLGDDLRDRATQMILSAVKAGTDFKGVLPPAVQNSATIQTAKFEDAGVGTLGIMLGGQVEISSEQANALASQLNQARSNVAAQ